MFAAFYDENGSRTVNGAASGGRAAITATVRAYVAAFPDMVVKLDSCAKKRIRQSSLVGRAFRERRAPASIERELIPNP
jgi:hypothetical protein